MTELYTSAMHLKEVLAGRATAVFTMAPEEVLKVLDPAFFPGMGALNEDKSGRLQCPVRGCGRWFMCLGQHLYSEHRAIGGVQGLRRALGIPQRTALLSRKARRRLFCNTRTERMSAAFLEARKREGGVARGTGVKAVAMRRNIVDTCPGQLQEKMAVLTRQLGRSVSMREFTDAYGYKATSAVRRVFGTWNNAKALCGLVATSPNATLSREFVVESLRAWIGEHGDLPTSGDVQRRDRAPMVPTYVAILRAFGVSNWPAAMRSARADLGTKAGRVA